MLRNVLIALFLLCSFSSDAQNQNWIATGIDGKTYNIDSIVNAGKTVLVDISANWCMPCWDWHLTGIMEKIYKEFGPDGTNDVEILFIDGDPGSSMANLQGATLGSMGNWVATTPYPIIGPYGQGNNVQQNYSMVAYPTLYMHCPGASAGVIIQMENSMEDFLESWHNACPAGFDNGTIDATLFHNEEAEYCQGSQPFAELFNQGTDTLYAATLLLKENGNLLDTKNWTGTLPPFQIERVHFDNYIYTSAGTYDMEVVVAGDVNSSGNMESESVVPAPLAPNVLLTLDLLLDASPMGTKWKLYDENNSVVASSPVTNYLGNHFYTYNWVLNPSSCYTFVVYDSVGGNGLCCSLGQGYYKIRNTADTLDNFIYGGEFIGFSEQRKFLTPGITSVDANNLLNQSAFVYPNPSGGTIRIKLKEHSEVDVVITNVIGEKMHLSSFSKSEEMLIDLNKLNNGIYLVKIISDSGIANQQLILNR